ncbi:MAG TPA: DUF4175 family protein [Tepidisphaeraceae bacterium]|nr:DUF4175 family protein [Tepidisphaeraceae bacterium]
MPPTILMQSLEALRRKVKLLGVAYGVGLLLASAVALFLAAVLLDYMLNLPAVPRLVITLAALGTVGYVLVRYVLRPAMSRLSIGDVAGKLETTFPQFDDRLRSTVNFLRGERAGEPSGSDVMKQRVITEASSMAATVDLNRALVMRPVWYSTAAGAGAIVLLILLAVAVSPMYRNIALSRLFTPFAGAAWPKRVQIDLMSEVPTRVPVGQRVELKMKLAKGDRESMKAIVHYQYGIGPWQQELMTRGADGTYTASLDARVDPGLTRGAMNVRIAAGDDAKVIQPIEILPRLAVTRVEAVITPPKYVADGKTTAAVNLTQGPAMMPMGSDVALHITFNKPLDASAGVKIIPVSEDMKLPQITWETNGQTVVGKLAAAESLRFHVIATDADGFRNSGIEEYELIVKPDQAPTVQIELPRRNEERTPIATVPLQAIAEDDYGVQGLKLIVDRISGAKQRWEIDLVSGAAPVANVQWTNLEGAGDRQRFRANHAWDLAQLPDANLKPGDVLEYHLLVKDNFDLAGQFHEPVPSGKLRITIISQEQLADAITNELRTIAGNITEIRNGQNRTEEETTSLAKETEQKPELDAGDRAAAERLGGQQSTAASQAKQVAGKLEAVQQRLAENKSPAQELNDLARDVKDTLHKTAEEPMRDAVARLGDTHQQNLAPAQRNETLASAVASQQQAADNLQRALDRMQNIGSLQTAIDQFRNLLVEQEKLSKDTRDIGKENMGKTPQQMKEEDRKKLEENAKAQEDLAAKTQKALENLQKTSDQMSKADPASSQAMSSAAKTGQTQQVAPNQKQAAAQAKQNQQAQAQAAQKKAELGLEMIINQLREAERRKLEELSKKLEELQKQIQNLIRRQAGHNLDNLSLQGPPALGNLNAEQLTALQAKAERAADALPPVPQIPQLSTAQEQTERNTRDIARTVENVPSGSEPAARLTRAAAKMERAIVSLRAEKLADAYDPPQVEALAELEEAKAIVDEQKRQIDQQKDQQQKEAIRQVYIKIKADQEVVNADTARIDVLRTQGRELPRNDGVRLGQLPIEQAGLSKRTSELEEDLSALGSIIYIWANKDIVGSMDLVKEDLAKPATGVPTRAEQTRVVEQLDAMIRNLAIKPMERQFESRGGGGGGGGGECPPMLPTESELRLLKDLQLAINKSTKTIDAEKVKDQPKLVALGNRQGELRSLLDETIKKASNGAVKLGPEPDPKDQLPEEAGKEEVEKQELVDDLLQGPPDPEKIMKGTADVGQRMARSRQRLALNNDPGRVTQLIQERIILDLDGLIEQARKQECQPGASDQQMAQKPGTKKEGQRPTGIQANNQGKNGQSKPNTGSTPADQSTASGAAPTNTDLSQAISQSEREWGQISKRQRDAVLEGASEQPLEKYRKLVEDYYRGVSTERQ